MIQSDQKPNKTQSLEKYKCSIWPITNNGEMEDYAIRAGERTRAALMNFENDPAVQKTMRYLGKWIGLPEMYWSEFDKIDSIWNNCI